MHLLRLEKPVVDGDEAAWRMIENREIDDAVIFVRMAANGSDGDVEKPALHEADEGRMQVSRHEAMHVATVQLRIDIVGPHVQRQAGAVVARRCVASEARPIAHDECVRIGHCAQKCQMRRTQT